MNRSLVMLVVMVSITLGCSTASKHPRTVLMEAVAAPEPTADLSTISQASHESDSPQPVVVAAHLTFSGETDAAAWATPVAEGMTVDALEALALQHSPAIRQSSAIASQAVGIQNQVGLKPNPSLGYFGEEIGNDSAAGLHGAFVSQTFVRGGKLAWNRSVAGHDVQRARWLAEVQRYRVRNDVRLQFYEALGAQKRLELAQQFRERAREGLEISKARVEAQEAALPDVLQSEVQLSEVDLAIQRAEFDFLAAWNRLVAIAGVPELTPTSLVGDFDAPACSGDLETVYSELVAASPQLEAACAQVRRAKANLQRQRVQPIPNLNAQLGAGYDDGTGDEFANVQLTIPLPVHNQNQGNIQAAYAEYCAATQNVERLRMQLRHDLAIAMQSCQIASATVTQYESVILPKVRETLELMQKAQQAGEFDFLRVLTARRAYFDANLKYVAALTDLSQANTSINGLLLTGGLNPVASADLDDGLRGAALSGQ